MSGDKCAGKYYKWQRRNYASTAFPITVNPPLPFSPLSMRGANLLSSPTRGSVLRVRPRSWRKKKRKNRGGGVATAMRSSPLGQASNK